jgi:hypothetical protein
MYSIKAHNFLLPFMTLFFLSSNGWPQKLVQDSLILNIKPVIAESLHLSCTIDSVRDLRPAAEPRTLAIDEMNHYSFVPVDLYIKIPQPLTDIISASLLQGKAGAEAHLCLGINQLELSNHPFLLLFKKYQVNALATFYHTSENDSLIPQGVLVFQSTAKRFFFGSTLQKGYESAFTAWLVDLSCNVSTTTQFLAGDRKTAPYNYRPFKQNAPWMQLNAGTDLTMTNDGVTIDAQLHFTYPEATRLFSESPGTIRFRHQKKYDAIEYGLVNHVVNFRLDPVWLLQFKSNLFIGVNRWKDMKTVNHELYDALIGDFSISQAVHYHPQFARTLWFGCGLAQVVYYIDSQGFQFQYGLVCKIGFQL